MLGSRCWAHGHLRAGFVLGEETIVLTSFKILYIGILFGLFCDLLYFRKTHFGTGQAGQALEPSEAQILVSHRTEMLCTLMLMAMMVMISLTVMMTMAMTPMMMQIMIDAMMMTTCAGGGPCGLKVCDTVA